MPKMQIKVQTQDEVAAGSVFKAFSQRESCKSCQCKVFLHFPVAKNWVGQKGSTYTHNYGRSRSHSHKHG